VVILTMSDARADVAEALRLGVQGYLLKDMEPEAIADSIWRAAQGELVMAPAVACKLGDILRDKQSASEHENAIRQLTGRERQILAHVAAGRSNKAIARALGISHDTVKLHVRHILAKLSLSSRVEAAVFAVEHRATLETLGR
jgi:two-component system nitrate/nitrite response regulator NarL